ncbi:hypothetical protein DPV78_010679 [Talaromyces pinophilus]|nr:hypothetical protein DPV78_010679 [Talaromyces pinophilus]
MPEYQFLITPHSTRKNLSLAIGISTHGFKFLPGLGKYIVDPTITEKWKWQPGPKLSAYEASPHPEAPEILSTLRGWEAPPKRLL